MKIQKSNNPLAVGALLCVLALVIGRTVWLVTRGDGTAQTATAITPLPTTAGTTTVGAPVTPSVPRTSAPGATPSPMTPAPRSARNPFASRTASPLKAHVTALSPPTAPPAPHAVPLAGGAAITELRPAPLALLPVTPLLVKHISARPTPKTPPVAHAPAPDPLQGVRLTAIVNGTQPMAVLQTADPQPVIIHVGDTLLGLRVIAIHDADVVFAQGDRRLPLPLQTADTTATVTTSDAAAPTTQENADASQ